MSKDSFDWDAHMATSPYNMVLKGMRVARRLIPTMISPDGKLVFLATYDLAFRTNDAKVLMVLLEEVYNNIGKLWDNISSTSEELYRNEVDYRILWDQLSRLSKTPKGHEDPNERLQAIFKAGKN